MKKIAPISFALAVALFGCADSTVGDDGDGSGSGSGSQEPQPDPSLDATGTYRLNSTFDLATNLPGGTGSFLDGLIEATDDPDDPMSWLLDQMIAQMDPGTLKDILVGAKPFVTGYLNDRLTQLAPELVGTIDQIGDNMAAISKKLGLDEKLEVNSVDQVYISRVTADGVRFELDGNVMPLAFADHDIDHVIVDNVLVTLENETKFLVGEHTLPLPYGKIVRLALDTAVIPTIDPNATGLADLLDNVVDCQGVGTSINDALGFGSVAFWESVCHAGLEQAANLVYEQIAASDQKLDLHLTGSARATDSNSDYKLDKLTGGVWTGTMTLDATDAPLAQPATFVGARI
jgi:hypothetical protein